MFLNSLVIQKVGQYPSLATIANDELAPFRKRLSDQDGAELYAGIGFAAHGAGVGAFVYLRRVFERLVVGRFKEFQQREGWDERAFRELDMVGKIKLLKDHLPTFLLENVRIYSILSLGIHELEESQCTSAFEMLRESIFIILEDDERKRLDLERRQKMTAAIAGFDPSVKSDAGG